VQRDADQQLQYPEEPMIRKTFKVTGITCAGCATDIETVLRNTEGVVNASVNYSAGDVVVEYGPGETNEQQITSALKKLGLEVFAVV
jgi:Cu2+-exporting ATPase